MFIPTLITISFCLVATVHAGCFATANKNQEVTETEVADKIITKETQKPSAYICKLEAKKVVFPFKTWMSKLEDTLPLSEISIPGTHDTGAFKSQGFFKDKIAQTQVMDIEEQLNSGIRALDIRCRCVRAQEGGFAFTIHHGPVYLELNFNDVLDAVKTFLTLNSSEFVLMRIREEHKAEEPGMNFSEVLLGYTNHPLYSQYFWLNVADELERKKLPPSLGRARGKIVILDDTPEKGFGPSWQSFPMQDNYNLEGIVLTSIEIGSVLVNHIAFGKLIDHKFNAAKKFFEEEPAEKEGVTEIAKISFTSASYGIVGPYEFAKGGEFNYIVTKRTVAGMNDRIEAYLKNNKIQPGWVFMDFPEPSLIETIIKRNFA